MMKHNNVHPILCPSLGWLVCACFFCLPLHLSLADEETDYFDMSLDELAAEYRTVVSGSRQVQPENKLSVPVTVITADDIHNSGLTNIPEILQFYVGMDVIRLDRNNYAVGVRGLHSDSSGRTLPLINGRKADNVVYGDSEYNRFPLLMEDIERIEILRGPGGAAWGANAFNGVVNIITKTPEDVQTYDAHVTLNEFGDTYTHLRASDHIGKYTWRTSLGYESMVPSDQARAGSIYELRSGPSDDYSVNDFSRNLRFDSEVVRKHSENTSLSLGMAYAHNTLGNSDLTDSMSSNLNTELDTLRTFVRLDQMLSTEVDGYVQWYTNYADSNVPSTNEYSTLANNIDAQYNLKLHEDHDTSIGGNLQWWRINMANTDSSQEGTHFLEDPYDEQQIGVFVIDRWHFDPQWTLEGQFRVDYYSGMDTDWSARGTSLYALDTAQDHVLRISIARTFRTPLVGLRNATYTPAGGGPGGGGAGGGPGGVPGGSSRRIHLTGSKNLENERTWAIEGSYNAKLSETVMMNIDTYFQRYENIIGYIIDNSTQMGTPANIDSGYSYGLEIEAKKSFSKAAISAWYAFNGFEADSGQFGSYAPAPHKVGCRFHVNFEDNWVFATNYRYTAATQPLMGSQTLEIDENHRLDLSLSKQFLKDTAELMLGISDLLNEENGPNLGLGARAGHSTPGRTFFARFHYRFK